MRDDNDSGYKSTCANEKTVDETGLPRTRELAYELSTRWVRASRPGLGWIWPGLAGSSLGWVTPAWPGLIDLTGVRSGCCAQPVRAACARGQVAALAGLRWLRRWAGQPGLGLSEVVLVGGGLTGEEKKKKKERKRKRKKKKKREKRESVG